LVTFLASRDVTVRMTDIPFGTTDWSSGPPTERSGTAGLAYWRTMQFGDIRVRMVEYAPGYVADHWCTKGHILLCLEGELHTRLEDGRTFVLTPGMSYQVADVPSHIGRRHREAPGCSSSIRCCEARSLGSCKTSSEGWKGG
jgi:hypothetical protein